MSPDVSSFEPGAVIMQQRASNETRRVACAIRANAETEHGYAQIEKEDQTITQALEHWVEFLNGMRLLF